MDNCKGEVRVIIAIAKDEKAAASRSLRACFPQEDLRMRIVYIDEEAREFRAERIENAANA
jgi:hypothetical protein